MRQSCIYHIQL